MPGVELRSDNAAGVVPAILDAIVGANEGSARAYGDDPVTAQLQEAVRAAFEHPGARAFPVTSGTAANALGLSALLAPWGAGLCHESAHVLNTEGGATSLLGGGAVLRGIPGAGARIHPDGLRAAFAATRWGDPHHSQPMVLSLTQATDHGTVYTTAEIAELAGLARERGLRVHMDGARIANAVAAAGCSPADMTWRAGVDVLSLGATKNGALSAEAIVCFDDRAADELVYRTKRSGHVTSKMRFQSAQLVAYLADGAWLRTAAHANAQLDRIADGLSDLGVAFVDRPAVNMLFARVDDATADRLEAVGLRFYRTGPQVVRLVTSWQTTDGDVEATVSAFRRALAATD